MSKYKLPMLKSKEIRKLKKTRLVGTTSRVQLPTKNISAIYLTKCSCGSACDKVEQNLTSWSSWPKFDSKKHSISQCR